MEGTIKDPPAITRKRWGGDIDQKKCELKTEDIILPHQKLNQLQNTIKMHTENLIIKNTTQSDDKFQSEKIIIDNHLVTQTVDTMNKSEKLKLLIDGLETKTNDILYNIEDIPTGTISSLYSTDKFLKPLWFIPPKDTKFTKGVPQQYPQITKPIVEEALRKALCGLLRNKGYYDIMESSLITFIDAIDEFYKCFMETVNDVMLNEGTDLNKHLDILTLEKGYQTLTRKSLTTLHNYYKHEVIVRNQTEINGYNSLYEEYDNRLKQESSTSGYNPF